MSTRTVIRIHWTGKVVSDNRKTIRIRGGRQRNSDAYKAFRASVAWTIKAQAPGVQMERTALKVRFGLVAQRDAQNCLKGLLDGIQDSGLVSDDRNISPITVLPTIVHGRGAVDEAWMEFRER